MKIVIGILVLSYIFCLLTGQEKPSKGGAKVPRIYIFKSK